MAESTTTIPTLDELIQSSAATTAFANAARELEATKKFNDRVAANAGSPPVKVLRTIMQLLESHPDLAVDAIMIDGRSGCSDYRGTLAATLADGSKASFRFTWDCAWKADQVGWKSFFGDPDQQRAAREYGYRCFEVFERVA